MFDYVFGLPMHALVIHGVVVLVPLSAVCAMAYAAMPAWRRLLLWPAAVGALVSGVSAFVAAESGESLLQRVSTTRASTTNFELLSDHTAWGDRAKVVCLVFMLVTLVAVCLLSLPTHPDRPRPTGGTDSVSTLRAKGEQCLAAVRAVAQPSAVQLSLKVLLVVVSIAALVVVVITGHAGSAVVWDGLG